ncbi:histone deacetylase family protein [Oleomonas cavernae]|uniref:Histone deacetylase family protein n=1 Tax=Oleomonas cavernae TaxID=2320859 RepID=A0A418WUH6_9PROT|nr:histone deacetylase family protein [Oleomonas cavernae]RJF94895.1 histone deacetylase family protein [Oleomonas cavernae]
MSTILFSHPSCLDHDTGWGHPECADRLRAVMRALEAEDFHYLERVEAPAATREQLTRVHTPDYVDWVLAKVPTATGHQAVHLDADTIVSAGSGQAALHAAGAVVAAVDAVLTGAARSAFCAVRPPGHHAEPDHAMGFCIFNNVAVGAQHARAVHGLSRVAVVDFDVHHGNGTQAAFQGDPDLFYASTHQAPLYPGTGAVGETGCADNILNAPLPPGADGPAFRRAFAEHILPALDRFAPELILISAGFDGHALDPLANLRLIEADYRWVTAELAALSRRHCKGGLVSTLEGGYDLYALASSVAAHVATLMVH